MDTLNLRQRILLNQPHIESAKGDLVNFTTDMKAPLKECKIYFNPIQEGSGEPSLDNVRDIVGWNEVNIYNDPKYGGSIVWNQLYDGTGSTGTNGGITYTKLDNGTWEIKGTSDTTSGTAARRRQIKTPSWEANHVYWFSARAVGEGTQYLQMVFSNSGSIKATTTLYDGAFVKPTGKINQFSFRVLTQNITVDAIARPQVIDLTMLFGEEMADYIYNLEVSKSGAGKEYFFNLFPKDWYEYNAGEVTTVSAVNGDPYTLIPINWTDNIGTIYGGYVDLISGELVTEWEYIESYNGETLNTEWISDKDVYIEDGVPTSGAKVIYKLITPIHYQLTPQQLLAFKGENNIWSNTNGQIEIKFWTH